MANGGVLATPQGGDFWSWLTTPGQNTLGSVGGNPITATGQAPLSGLLSSGLDIWSLITGQDRRNANTAVNIADPLLPVQGTAQQQMAAFLADPGSVLKDPAFTAAEGVGAENVARLSGAAGMGNSGNKLADLFKFGQTAGLGFEQQKFGQLLSLLTGSPQAAQLFLGGKQGQNQTIGDLISQLFGGGGVGGILNQLPGLAKLLGIGTDGGGVSGLMDQGGINAGTLDSGGSLGDLSGFDSGGGWGGDLSGLGDLADF